jgi:hypothetical protein
MADLSSEPCVRWQRLYRHVVPDGTLRKDGSKVEKGAKNRKQQRKKP